MNKLLKRLLATGGVLAIIVVAAAAGVYVMSQRVIAAKLTIRAEQIPIPTDSLSIVKGKHLVGPIAKCVDCHGEDLGGLMVVDAAPMGRWGGTNLTRGSGGVAAQLKDEDWIRAIRHGVGRDGRKLVLMPSEAYNTLSPEDLGVIIAYAKQVPPVDREMPPITFGPVARALLAAGKIPLFMADQIDHTKPAAAAPMPGPNASYGGYLAHAGGCAGCHGPSFAGGKITQGDSSWPPASNLTPTGLQGYSEESFAKTLRTGVRPSGVALHPAMPWKQTGHMTDDEIRALWEYLKALPPREFGAR